MFDLDTLLVLIPALPLAAAVLTALAGPRLLRDQAHWPTIAALVGSCGLSLLLLVRVHEADSGATAPGATGYEHVRELWTWAAIDGARAGEIASAIPVPSPGTGRRQVGRGLG